MSKNSINVIIVETSPIICEGLFAILTAIDHPFNIHFTANLGEVQQINIQIKADIILINPTLIQNQIKIFHTLKKELENIFWIGIVYSFFDEQMLSPFDEFIYIYDSPNKIIALLQNQLIARQQLDNQTPQQETLSNREINVLKLLVEGNANKEIADNLCISIHTVMTHRKNISHKTGIKSVSGLTIYAVVNKIISL